MRHWKAVAVTFVGLYIVLLLVEIPASQAVRLAGGALGPLRLQSLEGKVYSGEASTAYLWDLPLGRVDWVLSPWASVKGCAQFRLRLADAVREGGAGDLGFCLGHRTYMKGLSAEFGAAQVGELVGAGWVNPEGTLRLKVASLELDGQNYTDAQGRIDWQSASLGPMQPVNLGTVSAGLSVEGGRLVATVRNQGGDLSLALKVRLDGAGRYDVEGSVSVRDGGGASPFLSTLFPNGLDGSLPVRLTGRL